MSDKLRLQSWSIFTGLTYTSIMRTGALADALSGKRDNEKGREGRENCWERPQGAGGGGGGDKYRWDQIKTTIQRYYQLWWDILRVCEKRERVDDGILLIYATVRPLTIVKYFHRSHLHFYNEKGSPGVLGLWHKWNIRETGNKRAGKKDAKHPYPWPKTSPHT